LPLRRKSGRSDRLKCHSGNGADPPHGFAPVRAAVETPRRPAPALCHDRPVRPLGRRGRPPERLRPPDGVAAGGHRLRIGLPLPRRPQRGAQLDPLPAPGGPGVLAALRRRPRGSPRVGRAQGARAGGRAGPAAPGGRGARGGRAQDLGRSVDARGGRRRGGVGEDVRTPLLPRPGRAQGEVGRQSAMTDFEDKLAELRPVRAPEALWDRIRSGKLAERRIPSFRKDAISLAAAALLLAALYVILLPSPEPMPAALPQGNPEELVQQLKGYRHKVVTEGNRDGNWDLWLVSADGSAPVNLTKTPDVDEVYPKVSPDGTKIVFCADEGKGEEKVRNLYVMDVDGGKRTKIADNSREPCWSGDGKKIAFLRGELDKFTYSDFATKGIFTYDLATGQVRQHPNKKIEHLYTLNWTPDGKWFIAPIHGGMGFKHGILALEAEGEGVYDLKLSG